jgi:hypothetical protein
MPRPHSGFAKRQKELARSEKRKSKLARRQKSKDGGEGDPVAEDGSEDSAEDSAEESGEPSTEQDGGEGDGAI